MKAKFWFSLFVLAMVAISINVTGCGKGSKKKDGEEPSAKGYKSPEEVFEAAKDLKPDDIEGITKVVTKESRDFLTGTMIQMASELDKEGKILKEYGVKKDALAEIGQKLPKVANDKKELVKLFSSYGAKVKNQVGFLKAVKSKMDKVGLGKKDSNLLKGAKLEEVTKSDDGKSATGKVETKKGKKLEITFYKTDEGWLIDLVDFMMNQQTPTPAPPVVDPNDLSVPPVPGNKEKNSGKKKQPDGES